MVSAFSAKNKANGNIKIVIKIVELYSEQNKNINSYINHPINRYKSRNEQNKLFLTPYTVYSLVVTGSIRAHRYNNCMTGCVLTNLFKISTCPVSDIDNPSKLSKNMSHLRKY